VDYCKVDYCKSVLAGMISGQLQDRLQSVLNTAARLVLSEAVRTHNPIAS